eukprot:1948551-Amphidinium_carterae.2
MASGKKLSWSVLCAWTWRNGGVKLKACGEHGTFCIGFTKGAILCDYTFCVQNHAKFDLATELRAVCGSEKDRVQCRHIAVGSKSVRAACKLSQVCLKRRMAGEQLVHVISAWKWSVHHNPTIVLERFQKSIHPQ